MKEYTPKFFCKKWGMTFETPGWTAYSKLDGSVTQVRMLVFLLWKSEINYNIISFMTSFIVYTLYLIQAFYYALAKPLLLSDKQAN